jgi:hypothetical protein
MAATLYINSWEGLLLTSAPTLPATVSVPNPQWNRNMDPSLRMIDVPPRTEVITLSEGPSIAAVQKALDAVAAISQETPWQPRSFTIQVG